MISTFSVNEPTRNEVASVGLTAVEIAPDRIGSNNERKVITVRNTSPNSTDTISVWLSTSGVATNGTGVVLKQYESFTDSADGSYKPYQGKITAICATATGTASIFER